MRVFLASLAELPPLEPTLTRFLTPSRRAKALSPAQPQDRDRAILAGLLLREVLGVTEDSHLRVEPSGRPRLTNNAGPWFSLSHSGPYAALSVGSPIHGLDIQEFRSKPITESLARWSLSPVERQALGPNPDPNSFIRVWTMKEAYVKATGQGLAQGFNTFSVLPSESGPRPILGQKIYFHLLTLPDAVMSLASLTSSFPPLMINLSSRLSKFIKLTTNCNDKVFPLNPIYTF